MNIIFVITLLIHSAYSSDATENDPSCELSHYPPKPDSECCGVDSTKSGISFRIFGGKDTLKNQYPWMALLEFINVTTEESLSLCGGFLISGQYVVTAAHCFADEESKLVNVILGAHKTPFSKSSLIGKIVSNDTAVRVPIEKVTLHSEFDNETLWNDIALIKLSTIVKYSESIRPICLPESDITLNSPENLRLYSAGWGVTMLIKNKEGEYFGLGAIVKKHVNLPLKPLEECDKYEVPMKESIQMCAGGEKGKDVCMGDSGGPLMYEDDGIYQAVGIVSYGANDPCGRVNSPGVYTKVIAFKEWIMRHIEADFISM